MPEANGHQISTGSETAKKVSGGTAAARFSLSSYIRRRLDSFTRTLALRKAYQGRINQFLGVSILRRLMPVNTAPDELNFPFTRRRRKQNSQVIHDTDYITEEAVPAAEDSLPTAIESKINAPVRTTREQKPVNHFQTILSRMGLETINSGYDMVSLSGFSRGIPAREGNNWAPPVRKIFEHGPVNNAKQVLKPSSLPASDNELGNFYPKTELTLNNPDLNNTISPGTLKGEANEFSLASSGKQEFESFENKNKGTNPAEKGFERVTQPGKLTDKGAGPATNNANKANIQASSMTNSEGMEEKYSGKVETPFKGQTINAGRETEQNSARSHLPSFEQLREKLEKAKSNKKITDRLQADRTAHRTSGAAEQGPGKIPPISRKAERVLQENPDNTGVQKKESKQITRHPGIVFEKALPVRENPGNPVKVEDETTNEARLIQREPVSKKSPGVNASFPGERTAGKNENTVADRTADESQVYIPDQPAGLTTTIPAVEKKPDKLSPEVRAIDLLQTSSANTNKPVKQPGKLLETAAPAPINKLKAPALIVKRKYIGVRNKAHDESSLPVFEKHRNYGTDSTDPKNEKSSPERFLQELTANGFSVTGANPGKRPETTFVERQQVKGKKLTENAVTVASQNSEGSTASMISEAKGRGTESPVQVKSESPVIEQILQTRPRGQSAEVELSQSETGTIPPVLISRSPVTMYDRPLSLETLKVDRSERTSSMPASQTAEKISEPEEKKTGQTPDLDNMAREVYKIIKRRLVIDRERISG